MPHSGAAPPPLKMVGVRIFDQGNYVDEKFAENRRQPNSMKCITGMAI
jgi:hypothetical protein